MIYVGISGWIYPGWRGRFYPEGLPQRAELAYASRRFTSIEVNGTFYSLKPPEAFRRWHAATPPGFVFALKGGRYITHMIKGAGAETALANFFASGVLALGAKLGPILWQFPERFRFDAARLAAFLDLLPKDTAAAAELASRHEARVMRRGVWAGPLPPRRPLRHAIEVRHASFADEGFPALLRRHGVALVVSDSPRWPKFTVATGDFFYLRLHGAEELYASGYDAPALERWAARIRDWASRGDVYVYFDNDAKVRAPFDALDLMDRLGVASPQASDAPPVEPAKPGAARRSRGDGSGDRTGARRPGAVAAPDLPGRGDLRLPRSMRRPSKKLGVFAVPP